MKLWAGAWAGITWPHVHVLHSTASRFNGLSCTCSRCQCLAAFCFDTGSRMPDQHVHGGLDASSSKGHAWGVLLLSFSSLGIIYGDIGKLSGLAASCRTKYASKLCNNHGCWAAVVVCVWHDGCCCAPLLGRNQGQLGAAAEGERPPLRHQHHTTNSPCIYAKHCHKALPVRHAVPCTFMLLPAEVEVPA